MERERVLREDINPWDSVHSDRVTEEEVRRVLSRIIQIGSQEHTRRLAMLDTVLAITDKITDRLLQQDSSMEKFHQSLDRIEKALLGDASLDSPGLVSRVKALGETTDSLNRWRLAKDAALEHDTRRLNTWHKVWPLIAAAVAAISGWFAKGVP